MFDSNIPPRYLGKVTAKLDYDSCAINLSELTSFDHSIIATLNMDLTQLTENAFIGEAFESPRGILPELNYQDKKLTLTLPVQRLNQEITFRRHENGFTLDAKSKNQYITLTDREKSHLRNKLDDQPDSIPYPNNIADYITQLGAIYSHFINSKLGHDLLSHSTNPLAFNRLFKSIIKCPEEAYMDFMRAELSFSLKTSPLDSIRKSLDIINSMDIVEGLSLWKMGQFTTFIDPTTTAAITFYINKRETFYKEIYSKMKSSL